MLIELRVQNFAIIENLNLTFGAGLNILSGETGAGKSVLLKSLSLLMGEKSEVDVVRSGVESAVIEGHFDLAHRADVLKSMGDMGLDISDEALIVRRTISQSGKSKVYLNGSLSPLSALKSLVAPLITVTGQQTPLIEMTGQHDNRHLQSKAYHLDAVDSVSGTLLLRQGFEKEYERLNALRIEIRELEEASRSREQRLDYLRFQHDEIAALNLKPGEEVELETQVARTRNLAKLTEYVQSSVAQLDEDEDSLLVRLHQVQQRGNELSHVDPALKARLESFAQAKALVEDGVHELRRYGQSLQATSLDLESNEERLSNLRKLQKKFGATSEEILATFNDMSQEIERLEGSDENLKSLNGQIKKLETWLSLQAKELHERRRKGALTLEKGVNSELLDLNMKGVTFMISVNWNEAMTASGQSDIEFQIQASKKDEPKPIAKVASGGELSRILLALKRVIGSSDRPRTYLFDEVDTGVSGQTAEKVGRKLKEIAKGQQLICVTHLPQVACFADQHFLIDKATSKSAGTLMSVVELDKTARIKEIARLISGETISKSSMDHARQLLATK